MRNSSYVLLLVVDLIAAIQCYSRWGMLPALGWITTTIWTAIEWFESYHFKKLIKEINNIVDGKNKYENEAKPKEQETAETAETPAVQAPQA